jgi:hypothetical protein
MGGVILADAVHTMDGKCLIGSADGHRRNGCRLMAVTHFYTCLFLTE